MNKKIIPAVAIAIFNNQGEILLQKRKDVNQWCVLSGHVEFGETIENAVIREIKEETNLNAHVVRLIGVYSSPLSQLYHYESQSCHYITSYFEAKLDGELIPGYSNEETSELRFFSIDNIPEELALMHPEWLSDALEQKEEAFIR